MITPKRRTASALVVCIFQPDHPLIGGPEMSNARPQFFRAIGYALKGSGDGWSVYDIISEARRDPYASHHVPAPRPAIVHIGPPLANAESVIEGRVAGAVDRRGHVLAKKNRIMLAVVASYPYSVSEIESCKTIYYNYQFWLDLCVSKFRNRWGEDIVNLIERRDETFPHIHAWIVPKPDENKFFDLEKTFEPFAAEGEARRAGLSPSGRRHLYKAAAEREQTWFYENIGAPCGLTRDGPRRRRLSRVEWAREKAIEYATQFTAEHVAIARREADEQIVAERLAALKEADKHIADYKQAILTRANELIAHHTAAARAACKHAEGQAAALAEEVERLKAELEAHGIERTDGLGWRR